MKSSYETNKWQFEGATYAVTIAPSTYKHGRTEADVWAVLSAPVHLVTDGTDARNQERVFAVGADSKGRPTEVLVLVGEASQARVVHAHKGTVHVARLLGR